MVHSHTPNLPEVTRNADIVIAAAGVPYMVQGSWLKPGAVVIDVGINHIEVRPPYPTVEFHILD